MPAVTVLHLPDDEIRALRQRLRDDFEARAAAFGARPEHPDTLARWWPGTHVLRVVRGPDNWAHLRDDPAQNAHA